MGLFTPKWKSSENIIACSAIRKIKYGPRKKEIILEILNTDKREDVLFTAVAECKCDQEFLERIYQEYSNKRIRTAALCFIENVDLLKQSITEAHMPCYEAVMSLSHHENQKAFMIDLLCGRIKIGIPNHAARFWSEVCGIIMKSVTEEEKQEIADSILKAANRYVVEKSIEMFKSLNDVEILKQLAGQGLIGQAYNMGATAWRSSDYVKHCARKALRTMGISEDCWNLPCESSNSDDPYIFL